MSTNETSTMNSTVTHNNMNGCHSDNIDPKKPYYIMNDIIYRKFCGDRKLTVTFTERGIG